MLELIIQQRFYIAAIVLFCIGIATLFIHPNLIKKIIGLNLMDTAVFLFLAAMGYVDGAKAYILAPVGLKVGDKVMSGPSADIKAGNALALKDIPVGTMVHNIEMQPGKGGQIARAAGMSAQIMARDEKYVTLKMPSGEMRYILATCKATIGQVGNLEHEIIRIGKAGKTRYLGIRPSVRGVVMNPCDHPHGGGEGKSPVGMPGPVTPWGKPALGYKTRKHKKASNKLIITRIN